MVDRSLAFSLSINNLYYEFLIRGFVFELWVEGTKLMGNMDMATTWAAFFNGGTPFYDQLFPSVRNFVPSFVPRLKVAPI